MKKDRKKFKWILNFVNFLYTLNIIGAVAVVAVGIFHAVTGVSGQHALGNGWDLTINVGAMGLLSLFAFAYGLVMMLLILGTTRSFLRNIIDDRIFIEENVTLAKRASLYLLLASLFDGGSTSLIYVNDFTFINLTFILVALLVWVFAKLLEKAVAIAQENEFTV